MKREELKALGLADEQIESIMKINGSDIENVKNQLSVKQQELKILEEAIKERDTQLESLKKSTEDVEGLKNQIAKLQEDNRLASEKYAEDLRETQINSAIKLSLSGKVHDEDLVTNLFDKTKLVIDNGKLIGLDEQLKSLQTDKKFLFKETDTEPKPGFSIGVPGEQNKSNTSMTDALNSAFGLTK